MHNRRHPVQNLTDQLRKHHAFKKGNFSRIAAFYLKLLLQEPFRILEEVNYTGAIRDHKLKKDPIFIALAQRHQLSPVPSESGFPIRIYEQVPGSFPGYIPLFRAFPETPDQQDP